MCRYRQLVLILYTTVRSYSNNFSDRVCHLYLLCQHRISQVSSFLHPVTSIVWWGCCSPNSVSVPKKMFNCFYESSELFLVRLIAEIHTADWAKNTRLGANRRLVARRVFSCRLNLHRFEMQMLTCWNWISLVLSHHPFSPMMYNHSHIHTIRLSPY